MRLAGPVYHTGYVVPDLEAAMRRWVDLAGVGPFAVFADFAFVDARHRGRPVDLVADLAFAGAGDSLIELVCPRGAAPSIYAERPPGPHHVGILVDDVSATAAAYVRAGTDVAFSARFPMGGSCAYLDTCAALGLFTELVERTPVVDGLLDAIRAAHRRWNGSDLTFALGS
jgi:catechol 2,3-dioxygenase-like lactoylglutathione lyase family enzyme